MRIKDLHLGSMGISLVSVLLGLLVGAIIMLFSGFNPIQNYINLFYGALGNPNAIGEVIRAATPLILTALGFSVANSAGFFNIGLAGQALVGWLASVWFSLNFSFLPGIILLPSAIIIGGLAGAFWSGIAGVLRAYFGASEVITTIMLNYVALYGSNAIVKGSMTKGDTDSSPLIPFQARLRTPFLEKITNNSTLHWGIIISIAMVILVWWLMKKTTLGFEIRAVGLNDDASRYAGMSTKKTIITAMLISGTLAGLGGAMEGLGNFQNIFVNTALPDIGFDGMSVSLLATGNPIGIIFSALLFGILKIGGLNISITSTTPSEIVNIFIAAVIFFVGSNYFIHYLGSKLKHKNKSKQNFVTETKEGGAK